MTACKRPKAKGSLGFWSFAAVYSYLAVGRATKKRGLEREASESSISLDPLSC